MARSLFFFFNDTATTEIYTLSLHDALPISLHLSEGVAVVLGITYVLSLMFSLVTHRQLFGAASQSHGLAPDRKSTRLNSSHSQISYAVFCLKKKTTSAKHTQSSRVIDHH